MIGLSILSILCHSAYLNVFTMILNVSAGVVAIPPTTLGQEAEPAVRDARKEMASAEKAYQEPIRDTVVVESRLQQEQGNRDRLYLQFKALKQLDLEGVMNSQEAQQAINRLSFLEYKGFDFLKKRLS
ncbi:hypothetical protein H4Q26_008589 [Puccinia striiformis f. sp. tritici PST-130]|nr:hypothetical protein H4Q26_008589 [Puccinia striiformis f. sp. tritici PST-130]